MKTYPECDGAVELAYLPPLDERGRRLVRFQKRADFLLPSRELLEVHATIAKILHASGRADRLEKIMRDREQIGCLAPNGGTDIQSLLAAVIV